MKTQRVADIAVGCLVAALGIFVLCGLDVDLGGGGPSPLPPHLPLYHRRPAGPLRGRTGDQVLEHPGEGFRHRVAGWRGNHGRSWSPCLAVAGYIALMNPLGLPLATFLYVTLATWYLKRSKWVTATGDRPDYRGPVATSCSSSCWASRSRRVSCSNRGPAWGFPSTISSRGLRQPSRSRISSGRWSAVSSGRWSACSPASGPSPGSRSCSP